MLCRLAVRNVGVADMAAAVQLLLSLLADDKKVWVPSTAANACVLQLSRAGLALTGGLVSCGLLQVMSGLACS